MGKGTDPQAPVKRRLWIVDDVELELLYTKQALGSTYELDLIADGAEVLERVASGVELPDVLVLDWHMTGLGGLEVLRFLREHERTQGLPILVFTGTGDQVDLLEALGSGADDYVVKGASPAEVRARVASLIRSKSLRERAERAERDLSVLLERERAARAEADAANRAKDEFLATVSHELRTPLTSILGWARILEKGAQDLPTVLRASGTIQRAAQAQSRLIDDLLDVARIVSGKLRLETAPCDLTDAVEQVVESVRPSAAGRDLVLLADLQPGCFVQGDPARLQQIASNLLTNAVKFTPAGGTVRVNLERWGDRVTLTVRDTGKGIAPELLDQIFQPFLQGEASSTRRSGGLGLGLAIVQRLVQLHGGAVSASSEGPGLGATFEVVLGAARSTPSAVRGPLAAGRADLTGLSVLVVEDDPDTRELLCGVLTACGARALEACSVQEALTLLDQQRPHVIVSDLAMPAQDGYELVRSVRRMDEARRSVPAIAITARARDADRSVALAAGFQAFLPKPFDVDALVELVLRHALPRDPA